MATPAVLVDVDRAARQIGHVLHVLAGRLEALVPAGSEGLTHGVALGRVELYEQLGPAVLDVKRLHDGPPLSRVLHLF